MHDKYDMVCIFGLCFIVCKQAFAKKRQGAKVGAARRGHDLHHAGTECSACQKRFVII